MSDEAMTSREKAHDDREGGLVYIYVEPLFKQLHGDPGFEAIINSMGLTK